MPSLRPVISRVTPDGTAMLLRTIVEQDSLLADAEAASVNVQDVALSSSFATAVGTGAGAAATRALHKASRRHALKKLNIMK